LKESDSCDIIMIYTVFKESDIAVMIKVARMSWLWHVIRTYVGTVHEQLLIAEPWGRR
jgi:hypothetical protein